MISALWWFVPYLRGLGTGRFLSDEMFRNGEQAVLTADVIALMDALEIERAIVAGFDWRAHTADIGAAKARLFEGPVITVPTVTIGSDFDGAAADGRAYTEKFSGAYSHRVLEGIGHNVPQEAPGAFTYAILEVGGGLP